MTTETRATPRAAWTSPERLAAWTFGAAMVVAFVVYLLIGKRNWFFLDEWDFLATRKLGSLHDLMTPHNEHWSTLPIIVYRVLWKLVGARTYMPYLLLVVVLHITAAALLRLVMRRAGVHPWLATAGALMFLFLGSGFQDIIWAFQIGFVGSLVCGLSHLLLSDHEGGFDWRDGLGMAFGLAGLMCSGVSVTLVAVVGLAVLIKRGWRMALVHTVPLGAIFGLWWLTYGRDSYDHTVRPSIGNVVDFVRAGLGHALGSMAAVGVVAVILVVVLVVGNAMAFDDHRRSGVALPAGPWALLLGAVLFLTIVALGRSGLLGVEAAKPSRYVHLLGAMMLPAITVGADALARRWRYLLPVLAVLLVFGIPANMSGIRKVDTINEALLQGQPGLVRTLPTVDVASRVPAQTEPDQNLLLGVTIGWLRQAHRSGRLPAPHPTDRRWVPVARTRLAVEQVDDTSEPKGCAPLRAAKTIGLHRGDRLRVVGGDVNVQLEHRGHFGPAVQYIKPRNKALVVHVPVVIRMAPIKRPVLLCR